MEYKTLTLEELETAAAVFVATLTPREGATIVALSGELGAGKTAFTKACARALGVDEMVTSPTFVLEKKYELPPGGPYRRLVHIDTYRLEEGADLAPLKLDELLKDPHTLLFVEWPERLGDKLPTPSVSVSLSIDSEGCRHLSYA